MAGDIFQIRGQPWGTVDPQSPAAQPGGQRSLSLDRAAILGARDRRVEPVWVSEALTRWQRSVWDSMAGAGVLTLVVWMFAGFGTLMEMSAVQASDQSVVGGTDWTATFNEFRRNVGSSHGALTTGVISAVSLVGAITIALMAAPRVSEQDDPRDQLSLARWLDALSVTAKVLSGAGAGSATLLLVSTRGPGAGTVLIVLSLAALLLTTTCVPREGDSHPPGYRAYRTNLRQAKQDWLDVHGLRVEKRTVVRAVVTVLGLWACSWLVPALLLAYFSNPPGGDLVRAMVVMVVFGWVMNALPALVARLCAPALWAVLSTPPAEVIHRRFKIGAVVVASLVLPVAEATWCAIEVVSGTDLSGYSRWQLVAGTPTFLLIFFGPVLLVAASWRLCVRRADQEAKLDKWWCLPAVFGGLQLRGSR